MAKYRGPRLYCAFCEQWGHTGPTCDRLGGLGAMMTAAVRPPLNPMGRLQKQKRGKRGGKAVKAKEARKAAVRADKAVSVGERVVVKLPTRQKDGMASVSGGADLSPPTLLLSSGAVGAGPKPTKALPREEEASASSAVESPPSPDMEMGSPPSSPSFSSLDSPRPSRN